MLQSTSKAGINGVAASWYFRGLDHLRPRIVFIVSLILVTVLGGTVGFMLIEHYSPFDAFYFTLTTITTVGYGEMFGLSHAGRVFNSFVIFFGTISLFLC